MAKKSVNSMISSLLGPPEGESKYKSGKPMSKAKKCPDCGCKLEDSGECPNCEEEADKQIEIKLSILLPGGDD